MIRFFTSRGAESGSAIGAAITGLMAAAGCQLPLVGSSSSPGDVPGIPFTRERLPNGLTVIYHEDHRLPLVTVNTWYHVGSKDESPGRSGFAHLFEHLMFMGTPRVPGGEFDRTIESAGGSNNASTSADRTNYFDDGPSNLLETLIYLEADRMEGFGRGIDQEKLDTQRRVVQNERRQSYENRPYGKAVLEKWKLLYPPGHPYHEPVIGSHRDLESATVEDVKSFFDRYYVPANASLVVAGDFDTSAARELVKKYFGKIPAGSPAPRPAPMTVSLSGEKRETIPDRVQLARVGIVYHSPALFAEGDADLDIAAAILGDGKASRLYRTLVYEKKLAQDIAAVQSSQMLGSTFEVQATARPGVDLEVLERAMDEEIAKLAEAPPTGEEVERARNGYEVGFWQRIEPVGGRADLLNHYQFMLGDPDGIGKDLGRYRKVTPESVRKRAAETFRPKDRPAGRLVLRVVPEGAPAAGAGAPVAGGGPPKAPEPAQPAPRPADEPSRKAADKAAGEPAPPPRSEAPGPVKPKEEGQEGANPEKATAKDTAKDTAKESGPATDLLPPRPPQPGPPRSFEAPVPVVSALSNGVPLWVHRSEQVPLVSLVLIVRGAGAAADPKGQNGLAALTASMLDEGAGSRGALELADELDILGATLTSSASRERGELRLSVLKRNLDRALDLFADVLLRPRFDPREWDRVKTLTVNDLLQRRDNPAAVARVALERSFFGDGHPYAAPVTGYAESVRPIELATAREFYQTRWRPETAAVTATGDISLEEVREKLEKRLAAWARGGSPLPGAPEPPPPPASRPRLVLVDKPKAPQTVISLAMPGIRRTDPLYPDLLLANTIFGGSFTSRLNQNLREEHEFTYGAGSNFQRLKAPGAFLIQTSVKTDVTGEALVEIARECRGMAAGLRPGELEKARANARTTAIESFATIAATAEVLASLMDAGLPPDEPRRVLERVAALSDADVEKAAKAVIRWQGATVALVGDREAIQAELAEADSKLRPEAEASSPEAGLPGPVVLDADGNPRN